MSRTVIKVENLSKQYRLGMVGAGTLREDLVGWWYRLRGKEDPYLTVGETNDRAKTGNSDYVWALRDVNFEVQQGEVLGIIGKNGAGKSTLLKLLSRVTAPTTGSIKAKGRIASLLEVGTGFHPELTGRENIYLNGAIMGMRRAEITRKLDEIIDFAGVQRYVDTPVKRYSSGMYVRLAFAVAAHLEPEILIVDEVLAVGDAEFQKKALGKMEDVSKGQGRTVLFVSHNMKSVKALCSRCLVMENGIIGYKGDTDEAIQKYVKADGDEKENRWFKGTAENASLGVQLVQFRMLEESIIRSGESMRFEAVISFETEMEFHANLIMKTGDDLLIFMAQSEVFESLSGATYKLSFTLPPNLLNAGDYMAGINFVKNRATAFLTNKNVLRFRISEALDTEGLLWYGKTPGIIKPKLDSSIELASD